MRTKEPTYQTVEEAMAACNEAASVKWQFKCHEIFREHDRGVYYFRMGYESNALNEMSWGDVVFKRRWIDTIGMAMHFTKWEEVEPLDWETMLDVILEESFRGVE